MIELNQPVPTFSLPATGGQTFELSMALGKPLVLYFYPRDMTPGCTIESGDFARLHGEFMAVPCPVFGISRDSLARHEKFIQCEALPFPLLSDGDEKVCQLFGVINDKTLYGKLVRGIERSTFLLDKNGILRRIWRKVKVKGHAAEVLAAARAL